MSETPYFKFKWYIHKTEMLKDKPIKGHFHFITFACTIQYV